MRLFLKNILRNFWKEAKVIRLGVLESLVYLRDRMVINTEVVHMRLRVLRISPWLSNHLFKIIGGLVVILCFYTSFYIFAWGSPISFPEYALVTVERGENLSQIADSFERAGVIKSAGWLKFFVAATGGDRRVIAGDYYFPKPVTIFKVVRMLHKGEFGLIAKRVTIQEGLSSFDIAKLLTSELPNFDADAFLKEVADNNYEGTLFPDTYFFMPNTKAPDVVLAMRENFSRQIKTYEEDLLKSEKPIDQIIIMASIIESESSHSIEAKRIISGILWKRLRLDMALQVDAPFKYYNGKHSYTLTNDDLKEDHPYNTYVNKGLPPTAISNPGIDSIRAAIAPTNTDYLYFMSDKSGHMYYAKDFAGHQANRESYLR